MATKKRTPTPEVPEPSAFPSVIRLTRPHGFVDEAGKHLFWPEGLVVTNPDHIQLLVARKAHMEMPDAD